MPVGTNVVSYFLEESERSLPSLPPPSLHVSSPLNQDYPVITGSCKVLMNWPSRIGCYVGWSATDHPR